MNSCVWRVSVVAPVENQFPLTAVVFFLDDDDGRNDVMGTKIWVILSSLDVANRRHELATSFLAAGDPSRRTSTALDRSECGNYRSPHHLDLIDFA